MSAASSHMKSCHSLSIRGFGLIVALLARFPSDILMRDPFWLSENPPSIANDVTLATLPLDGVFMRTGRVVLVGLTSIWLRVVVVSADVLV